MDYTSCPEGVFVVLQRRGSVLCPGVLFNKLAIIPLCEMFVCNVNNISHRASHAPSKQFTHPETG